MKTKRFLIPLFTVLLLCLGSCDKTKRLDKALETYAFEMNNKCPMLLDANTQLDRVVNLPGNELAFQMTSITFDKRFVDTTGVINLADWEQSIRAKMINQIRTNPGMQDIRKNKITVQYNFRDNKGNSMVNFTLRPADYQE